MRSALLALVAMIVTDPVLAQPTSPNPAATAAAKRRTFLSSIVVLFDIKEVREKGTVSRAGEEGEKAGAEAAARFPERQVVMQSESNRLVVQGHKVRYESNHPLLSAGDGRVIQERSLSATDGATVRKFRSPPTGGDRTNRKGIVADVGRAVVHKYDYLHPLLLACDGTDRFICDPPFEKYTPTGAKVTIGGVGCDEYRLVRNADEGSVTELYVSGKDDQLPKRMRYTTAGRVTKQIDVSKYREVGSGHFIPAEWTLTRYSAGRLEVSYAVTVRSVEVNPTLNKDEFVIQFPPGLDVEDIVAEKFYVVQDDGSWKEVTPEGRPVTPWWGHPWFLIGSATLAAGIVVVGWLRWRRRRHRGSVAVAPGFSPEAVLHARGAANATRSESFHSEGER